MKTILEMQKVTSGSKPITMVTSYDSWSARIIAASPVDLILVGDSAAMVMHGHPSTVMADVDMMVTMTAAVVRGAEGKVVIADMPFLAHRQGITAGMRAVDRLMKTGATAIKLEGVDGHEDFIRQVVQSGVPVMGHLGLTPQSVHAIGGFKVQGRSQAQAEHLFHQAKRLESLGCFSVVLECIPESLAKSITEEISIPTIGIGAGLYTDGQVLVLQDLLGLNAGFKPKFLKTYMNGYEQVLTALTQYHDEVQNQKFPSQAESYSS